MNWWWLVAALPLLLFPRLLRRWWYNRERAIFWFWDGRRIRREDPVVIYRRIVTDDEFAWDETPKQIDYGPTEADRLEAKRVTARCVRRAFGVPKFDGKRGWTEDECINNLARFVDWMSDLKKNTSGRPTSPENTEPQHSEP